MGGIANDAENLADPTLLAKAQAVGKEFVYIYYNSMNKCPKDLHRFYSAKSLFIHGGRETPGQEAPPIVGQQAIANKISGLCLIDCRTRILMVDSMPAPDNGVLIQVCGEISNNTEPMRRFMQTFLLAPIGPKKFFVQNNIFRYQDEVFDESDDYDTVEDGILKSDNINDPSIINSDNNNMNIIIDDNNNKHVINQMDDAIGAEEDEEEEEEEEEEEVNVVGNVNTEQDVTAAGIINGDADNNNINIPPPLTKNNNSDNNNNTSSNNTTVPKERVNFASLFSSSNNQSRQQQQQQPPQQQPQQQRRQPQQQQQQQQQQQNGNSSSSVSAVAPSDNYNNSSINNNNNSNNNLELFVGNINRSVSEEQLKEFFSNWGQVVSCRISPGRPKAGQHSNPPSIAFVAFANREIVMKILNSAPITMNGERLNVEDKRSTGQSGGGGGRGGGGRGYGGGGGGGYGGGGGFQRGGFHRGGGGGGRGGGDGGRGGGGGGWGGR